MSLDKELVSANRTITIYDGVTNKIQKIETSSQKWSEISQMIDLTDLDGRPIDLSKRKAVLRSTNGILELPDALIPAGDQVIFLGAAKQASGSKDFDSMKYPELRRAAKGLPGYDALGSNPTRTELLKVLKSNPELKAAKPKAKKEVVEKIKQKAVETTPDLETEVNSLKQLVLQQNVIFGKFLNEMSNLNKEFNSKVTVVKQTPVQLDNTTFNNTPVKDEDLAAEFKKLGLKK